MMKTLCSVSVVVSALMLQTLPAVCSEASPVVAANTAEGGKAEAGGWTGTVVETMNAGGYTYVQVDTGKGKIWAAGPQTPVKVGEKVTVPAGMPMKNFQSKSLNRTFDTIYFVGEITTPGSAHPGSGATNPHAGLSAMGAKSSAAVTDFSGLKKPTGGYTVAEIYADKKGLQNKSARVRGKVVKYNSQIMGKNWLHLQDGTGAPGSNDLTVTTAETAKVGDTVLVEGTLVLDKDFGYGYKYGVMVENAKVTVEAGTKP